MVLLTCLNPERMVELQEGNNLNIALAVLQAFRRYPESEWVYVYISFPLLSVRLYPICTRYSQAIPLTYRTIQHVFSAP